VSKKLEFEIGADVEGLKRSLDRATNQISIFGKKTQASLDRVGSSFQRVGSKLTVGLTLPILALGAAAIKSASDAEETASKYNTVFRDISKSASDAAEMLRNSYGLARQQSQKLLGDTGDLLTGFGFSQRAALDLSIEVNKLAVDLASFTNFAGGAEGASAALTKALLGERESVKSLGISILETDVQARVLLNTQQGLTFETERQARAYATLQIAQEQSKNAIGDYERTSGSFANQTRLLQARIKDLSDELGKVLLPFVTRVVTSITKVVDKFSEFEDSTKKIIVVVAGLAAAIGPVLIVLGTLLKSLPAIGAALTLLTGPVGLIVAGIAALTYVIYKNWDAVKQWAEDLVNWFIDLYNESLVFRAGIEALVLNFKNMFAVVKFVMKSLWTVIKAVVSNIVNQFKLMGAIIKAALTFDWDTLKQGLADYEKSMLKNIDNIVTGVKKDFEELTDTIGDNIEVAINNILAGEKEHVKFEASKESKENLKKDVADSVSEGVAKGLGEGFARAETTGVSGLEAMGTQTAPPTTAETGSLNFMAEVSEEMIRLFELTKKLMEDLDDLVVSSLSNTFSQLGTAIGEALAEGTNVLQAIGNTLLRGLGNFLSEMGQMLIEYGTLAIAKGTIDQAIASGGPVSIAAGAAAIAVGIALRAAGSAIASRANSGVSGSGSVSSNTASNAPGSNLRTYGGGSGGGNEYVFRISGRDLVSVVDRNRNHLDRIGG